VFLCGVALFSLEHAPPVLSSILPHLFAFIFTIQAGRGFARISRVDLWCGVVMGWGLQESKRHTLAVTLSNMAPPREPPLPPTSAETPTRPCASLNKVGGACGMVQGMRVDPDGAVRCMTHSQHPEAIARRKLNGEIGKLTGRLGGRPPQRRGDRETPPEAPKETAPPAAAPVVPEGLDGPLDVSSRSGREAIIRACLQNLFSGAWTPPMVAAVSGALGQVSRDTKADEESQAAGLLQRLIARHAGGVDVDD